ncbi:uncharacterized protein O3C94_004751 [Discoglossus pictus]
MHVYALVVLVLVGAAVPNVGAQRSMPGAPVPADANEEGVQRALTFAMKEFNKGSNDRYASKVTNIKSVQRQVVAGLNYIMEVEIGRTQCTKPASNLDQCELHTQEDLAKRFACKFVVYDIPWRKKTSLTKNQCTTQPLLTGHPPYITVLQYSLSSENNKMQVYALVVLVLVGAAVPNVGAQRSMPGAPVPADANGEGVQRALAFAMKEFNKGSNDRYASKVTNIKSVQRQLVAGLNYIMEVEIGRTQCTKPASNLDQCELHTQEDLAKSITCKFVVYDIPWRKKTSLTKNQCS